MEETNQSLSRRRFLENAALLGVAGTLGISQIAGACSRGSKKADLNLPPMLETAPDGAPLKAGVIGCGGRGTGAALDFLNAGPNLTVTHIADVFADRVNECRAQMKEEKGIEIPDDHCFTGLDAYKQVIESDVDVVILATPPYFRPAQFAACVEARKHVFMEKPVAIDPVGARSVMASAKKAETIGLSVVTGTQRRHQHDYVETYKKVMGGAIGDIVSANCYWNQSHLWFRQRKPEWSDMEFMLRDWVNWLWLSGDHISEQHIHNIDVINWFTGKFPVSAVGFGSRHRRVTGDQFDNFSIDFVYDGQVHMHSMCRQIDECTNNVSEVIRGTKGYTNCRNTIWKNDGSVKWKYEYPKDENGEPLDYHTTSPYVQEHIDLVTAIRTNKPVNEAETTAKSNLSAIMGRISAYTGKEVTWEEMMQSDLAVPAPELVMGPVDMEFMVPVPGAAPK